MPGYTGCGGCLQLGGRGASTGSRTHLLLSAARGAAGEARRALRCASRGAAARQTPAARAGTGTGVPLAFSDQSGRSMAGQKLYKADLRGTNFSNADLSNANLFGAFAKDASFRRAARRRRPRVPPPPPPRSRTAAPPCRAASPWPCWLTRPSLALHKQLQLMRAVCKLLGFQRGSLSTTAAACLHSS